METRSRKRAEVSSSAPSSSSGPPTRLSKRARLSSPLAGVVSASAPSLPSPLISSISTRSRASRSHDSLVSSVASMDLENDSSGSAARRDPSSRRGKDQASSRGNLGNGIEKDDRGGDSRARTSDIGVNMDSGVGDGNDSETGVGILHQNLTSASSALQGLLRKLGAGFDDLLPSSASTSASHQSGTLKKILSGLRADGEEGKQIEALTQLCEILCIGSEDSLGTFSVDSFVPVLVGLLNRESNPDIMLLAARAITHLCDVLPSSCSAVVHYGAVPSFCARLLTIEYMDLAEQSLQALKKISQEHPTACLRAGALMAVLSYLDFFSTGVQRVALSTAANMCKKLPSDAADFVMEAVPLLTNLLQYHDAKVLEHASICLTRISEAFASSPDKLDELCNHGLVAQAVSLISSSNSGTVQSALGTSTYTGLIRMLATFASSSPLGGKTLLLLGISGILKEILCSSSLSTSVSVSPTLNRPPDQIFEIVNLANELLPPLPEGILSLPLPSGILTGGSLFQKSPSGNSEKNGNASRGLSREKLLKDRPDLLEQFGLDFLPVLVQIFGSSVNSSVRNKCLLVMGKLMYFSSSDMIQSLLSVTNLASFLAGILTWRDPHAILPALQMAEILMDKLPSTFSNMFLREGVVHAVDTLIQDAAPFDVSGKNHDSPQGTLSRSRRSRAISSDGSVTLPPSSLEMSVPNPNLRTTVGGRAKVFKDKFFPLDSQSSGAGVTEDLIKLKGLCKKLNDAMDDQKGRSKGKSKVSEPSSSVFCATEEENLVGIVGEILRELSRGDGVSTFEFIGSGVIDTFLNYFSFGLFSCEKIPDDAVPKLRQQALKRSRSFVSVALPLNGGSVLPMSSLVRKLHSALASLERFPVVLSSAVRTNTSGGNPRSSSGLSILMQTVNLRLCRARDDTSLEDFSSNVVEIALLANISEIETFLWPRVSGNGSSSGTRTPPVAAPSSSPTHRHSARLRSSSANASDPRRRQVQCKAASAKGKGKGLLNNNNNNNATGPQTRNSARRIATSGRVDRAKSVEVESSSEDVDPPTDLLDSAFMVGDDDDDDDVSDDDEDDDDDDDVDVSEDVLRELSFPVGTYRRVHDVKLSEGDETSESVRNPSAVIGSASLAFAAMAAGLVSSDSIGERDPSNGDQKLTFAGAGGKLLSRNLTIYQAIQRRLVVPEEEETERHTAAGDTGKFFSGTYSITYQRGRNPEPTNSSGTVTGTGSVAPKSKPKSKAKPVPKPVPTSGVPSEPLLDTVLKPRIPGDLEKSFPTHSILALLRVLDALNQLVPCLNSDGEERRPRLGRDEFVSSKLTPKLTRQVQDTAVLCNGSVPSWCHSLTSACPFLFPFETRRQYFYSTAFGVSRALYRLQQQGHGSSSSRELRLGRLQRQKVRVSRNRILDSAVKVMEMYSSQKSVLEVEYFGEVGTGLGPTLEFYTLLSHELQKPELGIWRVTASDSALFPCPRHDDARLSDDYFRLLGRVVAKALKDGRLLDIPLSPAFYKLVLCEELAAHDVSVFDPDLGRTLKDLIVIVRRKKFLESAGRSDEVPGLSLHGVPIEDLCLDFSLPGYPDYPVKCGAENVTMENLEEYVEFVTDVTVNAGIRRQMEAFHAGFNQVFNVASLRIFSPDELDYLLCGRREMWQADTLVDYIKFDHGYTAKSPVILNLLEIMGELKPDEQRAFCQFVTGAPRLPPGGLSALNPKLTIVRKHSSSGSSVRNGSSDSSDHDLPSVMTCANYLKLPPYSTKEIMYKKLMYAVSEGQGSFDLS